MELKRMNVDSIFNTNLYEVYNGKYVEWTPELQEAWDKQQEVNVIYNGYGVKFCGKCDGTIWQNKDESKYCFRCGNKLKW